MSNWVIFFEFFQVFYLVTVVIAYLIITLIVFLDKVNLNTDELYQEFFLDNQEFYEAEGIAMPSKSNIVFSTWSFKFTIILMVPFSILIAFSRLISLHAFVTIKQHTGHRKGVAYNRGIQLMNIFFYPFVFLHNYDYI